MKTKKVSPTRKNILRHRKATKESENRTAKGDAENNVGLTGASSFVIEHDGVRSDS
tara:strand:- start:8 stop:175 length:168 start_codon:yes stop_codon:yes gene_type:complete